MESGMIEPMRDHLRSAPRSARGHPSQEKEPAAAPLRAFNGAPLRWTPGPDELRLPSEDDEPMSQGTRQLVAIVECFFGLRRHWRGRQDVFIGSDQFIHWDRNYHSRKNPKNPPVAPDVYVAFGVANRHRLSYVVWEEGKPPDFVLEVVSPSSRRRDEKEKPLVYAKMGVPEFFLYEPGAKRAPALLGFALRGGRGGEYRPLPADGLPQGAVGVHSEVLGLCLCVRPPGPDPLDDHLCLYDPAAGKFLPLTYELAEDQRRLAEDKSRLAEGKRQAEARAEASEARAEASEAKAEASAARVAELEALVEKMRRG